MRSAKRTGTYSLKRVLALFIVCVCTHVQVSVHVCVLDVEVRTIFKSQLPPSTVGFRNKSQTWQQFPYSLCQLVSPETYSFIKMPFL